MRFPCPMHDHGSRCFGELAASLPHQRSKTPASPRNEALWAHTQPQACRADGRCRERFCYLTSAIRVLPLMTSDIPLVNSRTLFLTQSAVFSLEVNASSALSNWL